MSIHNNRLLAGASCRALGCFRYLAPLLGLLSICFSQPSAIDVSESLAIGSFKVSAYQVHKNFDRWIHSRTASKNGPPSEEQLCAFFSRYLNQQVIIAEAIREGYGNRPEVTTEVVRMERHMLTSAEGPYYAMLFASADNEAVSSDKQPLQGFGPYQVEIIRVPRSMPLSRAFDRSYLNLSPADQQRRFLSVKQSGDGFYFEGTLSWPFVGYEPLETELETATPGEIHTASNSEYLFIYQLVSKAGLPVSQSSQDFLHGEMELSRDRVQTRHRSDILSATGFRFSWEAASAVADWLDKNQMPIVSGIPPSDVGSIGLQILGTYHGAGTEEEVLRVKDLLFYYNELYVRRRLSSATDIYELSVNFLLDDIDYKAALEAKAPEQSQFRSDRENYREYLALDLFEREQIRPTLGVSDDDVRALYHEQSSKYTRATRVDGSLASFSTEAKARAYAAGAHLTHLRPSANDADKVQQMELDSSSDIPEVRWNPMIILRMGANGVVGPEYHGGHYVVWTTEHVLSTATIPFGEAQASVRNELESSLLDQKEAKMARAYSKAFSIEDRINYATYGVRQTVPKPWST